MDNLIRHYRKLRGMTQTELAEKLETTTQSVSRLETGVMTLSTDWLERLGAALRVHPIALLPNPEALGAFSYDLDKPDAISTPHPVTLNWSHGAQHPVGLHLKCDCGPYRAHSLLIGDKLPTGHAMQAVGHDCIVGYPCGSVSLRRILRVMETPLIVDMTAINTGATPQHTVLVHWLAPLRAEMRILE
jgi:transcriptional regulator with XRE-family HTH domain